MSDQDALTKATKLLTENFALDTTLREVAQILRIPPDTKPTQSTLPGLSDSSLSAFRARERSETSRAAARRSHHKETIDLFVRLWRDLRGGQYRVVGGRDGSAVKTLISYPEATPQEIQRRMRIAFDDPWFKSHGNLAIFVSSWSNLDRPGGKVGQPAPRPSGQNAGRRVVGYDETTGELVYG